LGKKTVAIVLTLVIAVLGVMSYFRLGRLENPDFVIKTAVIATTYPGASPREVEEEVTDVLEAAIQSMGELKELRSVSQSGLSVIYAEMKDKFTSAELPQIWDKLRRKVNDVQRNLPPGAGPTIINDDFSDVYGLFYAITGDEYSYEELKEYAKELKKELGLKNKDIAEFFGLSRLGYANSSAKSRYESALCQFYAFCKKASGEENKNTSDTLSDETTPGH
jgi:multidrug efflux pump subunit AcrB